MNVKELIKVVKEKKEMALDRGLDFDVLPQLKDYWAEFWQNTKNGHWLTWAYPAETNEGLLDRVGVDEAVNDGFVLPPAAESLRQKLLAQMDQVTYTGDWYIIDQEKINAFADVSEDQQWIHTDVERAGKESVYRSTIAHGFFTLSLIPKLTGVVDADSSQFPNCKVVFNLGLNQVRFPAPVKCGSRIRATKKVVDVKAIKRGLLVEEEIIIEIENSTRPACVANPVYRLVF